MKPESLGLSVAVTLGDARSLAKRLAQEEGLRGKPSDWQERSLDGHG